MCFSIDIITSAVYSEKVHFRQCTAVHTGFYVGGGGGSCTCTIIITMHIIKSAVHTGFYVGGGGGGHAHVQSLLAYN